MEATYEATFQAAFINHAKTGSRKLFLTLVGGGAFGNRDIWIEDALIHSLNQFKNTPLDVEIVSYGQSNPVVKKLIEDHKAVCR
ncbi:MAG: hypothetical protein LAT68_00660 [Cyclobacteriaceae bacterium]|nr:hypothetical protein [Cyclobacteriaceae bacterium]MCH8514814.1 hypothetical protein [Cyclobacteriaceae bacterium]